jgi:hypothetical protein
LHQRLAEESYPRGDWRVKGRVGREQAGVQPDPSLMQQAVASNRCAARKIPCQHRRPVHALGLTRSTARKSRAADRRLHPIELLVLIANILYRPCAAASSSAQETFVKLRSGPPMRAQGQGVHLLRAVPVTPPTVPSIPAVSPTAGCSPAAHWSRYDTRCCSVVGGSHPARQDRGPQRSPTDRSIAGLQSSQIPERPVGPFLWRASSLVINASGATRAARGCPWRAPGGRSIGEVGLYHKAARLSSSVQYVLFGSFSPHQVSRPPYSLP